jgi:hypothetical protein
MTTPHLVRGLFSAENDETGWPVIRATPEARGELQVLLATAHVDEHRSRQRVQQRDPNGLPDEWTLRRHMLQVLDVHGEIVLSKFRLNEAQNTFGSTSVSFEPAVRSLFELLELEPPVLPTRS